MARTVAGSVSKGGSSGGRGVGDGARRSVLRTRLECASVRQDAGERRGRGEVPSRHGQMKTSDVQAKGQADGQA